METFRKEIYIRGRNLGVRILDDPSNIYIFIFNPETEEFSDIYSYEDGLEFELNDDGIYNVVTIKNATAQLTEYGLKIGSTEYKSEDLLKAIESGVVRVSDNDPDIDETVYIWNLKECLANLELQIFKELLKNCGSINCKNSEIKAQRDFLFMAIWLIENFLDLGDIEKAKMIYRNIQSCGSICKDKSNYNKNCGCNG